MSSAKPTGSKVSGIKSIGDITYIMAAINTQFCFKNFNGSSFVASHCLGDQAGDYWSSNFIDMNGDGQINRAEILLTNKASGIIDLGYAEESDGGNFSYNQDRIYPE